MTGTEIAAIITAGVAPIVTYIKLRMDTSSDKSKIDADAARRKETRDTQLALMEKRLSDVESKCDTIDELKDAVNSIKVSLARIEALIEMVIKGKSV